MVFKVAKEKKGITLIALVITIIVLLILAGVSVATLTGKNGLLTQAQKAKEETEKASIEEQKKITQVEASMNIKNEEYYDSKGNKAIIPAGFAVSQAEGEKEIDKGLVIIDSEGNEFVWIPVGNVSNGNETKKIELNRYTFSENGEPIKQDDKMINIPFLEGENLVDMYYQELDVPTNGNIPAKDINAFLTSVSNNGGYYVARYEASYGKDGKPNSKVSIGNIATSSETEFTEGMLWNFITQEEASKVCQNMYNSAYFTSDLINSYAWDTTILFIQTFSKQTKYSMQDGKSINDKLANTGTNGDNPLNINDFAAGIRELCTEYSSFNRWGLIKPCTMRGGGYFFNDKFSSTRAYWPNATGNDGLGFRPILYIN